jgi:hypothetical protein
MRAWMIPWLFPLALLALAVAFLISPWVGVPVALIVVVGAGAGWRRSVRGDGSGPVVPLPRWMSGWRPPR